MTSNLHKLYYRDYYLDTNENLEGERGIAQKNLYLLNASLTVIPRPIDNCCWIQTRVLYPGLITGVGLTHESAVKGEFKLGMHFDWTWGMPVIYGSSVKGVLRSCFEEYYKETDYESAVKDIFGGDKKETAKGKDVFFEAVIVSAPDNKPLADDAITPHGINPFGEPTPIPFIKIAPGCVIEFRFLLEENHGGIVAKMKTFRAILCEMGIGAKTNVGYGQLEYVKAGIGDDEIEL